MTHLSVRAFLSQKKKSKALFLPLTNQMLLSIRAKTITSALANLADSKPIWPYPSKWSFFSHSNVVPNSRSTTGELLKTTCGFPWNYNYDLKQNRRQKHYKMSLPKLCLMNRLKMKLFFTDNISLTELLTPAKGWSQWVEFENRISPIQMNYSDWFCKPNQPTY